MTPDEKKKYLDDLKSRGQAAVNRADMLLTDLAVETAKLKIDVKTLHDTLTNQLAALPKERQEKSA